MNVARTGRLQVALRSTLIGVLILVPTVLYLRHRGSGGSSGRCSEQQLLLHEKNFTVVTAYFNLGFLQKGTETSTRGPNLYFGWMWPYQFMLNAVVAFFDDEDFAATFATIRQGLPTKIVMVNRMTTWAFSLQHQTQGVFSKADYPKNSPKSTIAAYDCAMHAKYELMAQTVKDNPFGSRYFAWMDLGIFRDLPRNGSDMPFMLRVPRCHRSDSVMFAMIFPMEASDTVESVLRDGSDWVGGGFFLASGDVMLRFCDDYRTHVEEYLLAGLANHDQSVILAMYLPTSKPRPVVPLQAIVPDGSYDPWFYLAMRAREEGLATAKAGSAGGQTCYYDLHD